MRETAKEKADRLMELQVKVDALLETAHPTEVLTAIAATYDRKAEEYNKLGIPLSDFGKALNNLANLLRGIRNFYPC